MLVQSVDPFLKFVVILRYLIERNAPLMYVNGSLGNGRSKVHLLKSWSHFSFVRLLISNSDIIDGLCTPSQCVDGRYKAFRTRLQDLVKYLKVAFFGKIVSGLELLVGKPGPLQKINKPVWGVVPPGICKARKDLCHSSTSAIGLSLDKNDDVQNPAREAINRKDKQRALGEKLDVAVHAYLAGKGVEHDGIGPGAVVTDDEGGLDRTEGVAGDDEVEPAEMLEMTHEDGEPDAQDGGAEVDEGAVVEL